MQRRLKVVHILPLTVAFAPGEEGTSFYLLELYKHIGALFDFYIVSRRPQGAPYQQIPTIFLNIPSLKRGRRFYKILDVIYMKKLESILEEKWNIVCFYDSFEKPIKLRKFTKDKGTVLRIGKGIKEKSEYTSKIVDRVVGCCGWIKKMVESFYPYEVEVIYSATNTRQFLPFWERLEERKRMRANYEVNKDFCILFVGRITPEKGVHLLLEALCFIPKALLKRLKVFVVGGVWYGIPTSTNYSREVKKFSEENFKNVKFLGFINRSSLPYFYSMADLVVSPSLEDAFCTTNLEAMATGIPVLTTKVGGIPEVVGDAGVYVEPNPEELAKKMVELMDAPLLRKELGKKGRERAETLFDWQVIAPKWKELFLSLSKNA